MRGSVRRAIAILFCLQVGCISWRPVHSVAELTGTQVVRVEDSHGQVEMRNAHSCPDAASFTGTVLSAIHAESLLTAPRCECSAQPCAGIAMRPSVNVRVRQHDDQKTLGFVFGTIFVTGAIAAVAVVLTLFIQTLQSGL